MVRALWSAETTSAVTVAPAVADVVDDMELDDGLLELVVEEPDVDGLVEALALDDGLLYVDDEVVDDGLELEPDVDGLVDALALDDGLLDVEDMLDEDGLELLVRVLAVDLLIAVTAAQSCRVAIEELWLAEVEVEVVLALVSAFFVSDLQVRLTTSPAVKSFRLEMALP
jgi:hypothetical protein